MPVKCEVFFGLVNYCGRFIPDMATISEPLRQLTRKGAIFTWAETQKQSFEALKQKLCDAPALGYFDKTCQTKVIADASPYGLAAVLVQIQQGQNRVIAYASRTLSQIERKYSKTEKEALALVWACERFHVYLYGAEFDLLTDHKALEFIFSPRSKPSARIERWVLRLLPYRYRVIHIAGRKNIADSLSRLLNDELCVNNVSENDVHDYVKLIATYATPTALSTREIERANAIDPELCNVRECIASNEWQKLECESYLPLRNELTFIGCIILRGTRLVIPNSLRERVLKLAHEGHPGIVIMKRRLRSKVWWPGIDKDVEMFCKHCYGCQLVSQPSAPEPMVRTNLPQGPWQCLACDLLGPLPTGDYVFVVVDYFSRYFEIAVMRNVTSANIIASLGKMFATHGLPISITCDNGPQFVSSQFKQYLDVNGIKLHNVTPIWPQANGEVERQNRTLLKRIKIAQAEGKDWKSEIHAFLLMYRSTPHTTTGVSPAELLFGRKLRTNLPHFDFCCGDDYDLQSCRDRDAEMKEKGKCYGDMKRSAVNNDEQVGDKVLLKQNASDKFSTVYRSDPYTVIERNGNSVTVQNDNTCYKRNVTHVKKFNSPNIDVDQTNSDKSLDMSNDNFDVDPYTGTEPRSLRPRENLNRPKRFDH